MARLRSVFMKNGTVTAANASGINDGAGAMVIQPQTSHKQETSTQSVGCWIWSRWCRSQNHRIGPVMQSKKHCSCGHVSRTDGFEELTKPSLNILPVKESLGLIAPSPMSILVVLLSVILLQLLEHVSQCTCSMSSSVEERNMVLVPPVSVVDRESLSL